MTTYERILSELGDGLGIALSPDPDGIAEVAAEGRSVLLRADETGERELQAFTIVATAPKGGFPDKTLRAALEMNLFGREVAGHHLGLFANSLLLSATLPLVGLGAEELAERILVLVRLAGDLAGRLSDAADDVSSAADVAIGGMRGDGFLAV